MIVVGIFPLLFLASRSVLVEGKDAEILLQGNNERPSRIYREKQTALMKVVYSKPENFSTEWIRSYTLLGYDSLVPQIKKLNSTSVETVSNDGSYTETFKIETKITNSGNYTFRIFDPSTGQTAKTANFSLKIAAAPSENKIQKVGGGNANNLQLGQIYNFECSARGYPLPNITWEFSPCQSDDCDEDDWTPISSANEPFQLDATYYRKQQIGIKAEHIGLLRCVATNSEGNQTSEIEIVPSDIEDTEILSGFAISPQTCKQTDTYRGDQFNLTCQMQKRGFQEFLAWTKKLPNGTETVLAHLKGPDANIYKLDGRHQLSYDSESSNFSNKYVLTFNNISKGDAGYYICKTRDYYDRDHFRTVNLTVKDDFPPSMLPVEDNKPIEFVSGERMSLQCKANGGPPPTVIWYKDGQILDAKRNNHNNIIVNQDSLEFAHIHESDKGDYVCNATNRVGSAWKRFNLQPKTVLEQHEIVIIVALCVGSVLLICLFGIARMAYANSQGKQKLIKLEMTLKSYETKAVDDTLTFPEQIANCPKIRPGYKNPINIDSLDIKPHKIKVLGKGNFGVVIETKYQMAGGSTIKVVLKGIKNSFEVDQFLMLFKEICLMTYLKKHPNIVNMIGFVCNFSLSQLYLVLELCAGGSLENRLKSVRNNLQLRFVSELRTPYQNESGGNRYIYEDFPDWPVIKATLKGHIFHSDLISYAYQVTLAMEYLGSLDFVHRDLAARNVLLSHNFKVAKIADFGLSLQLVNHNYKMFDNQKNLQVPIRWTAPESILFKEFSSGSDVWSFGVLIGEIFSLGEIPFSLVPDSQFISKLSRKEITPNRPLLASDNIYQLMLSCCHPERRSRVSFTEAKAQLSEEFRRCSPDQMTSLLALLDGIQQEFDSPNESDVTVEGNSIFYTNQSRTIFKYSADDLPTATNSQEA